MVLVVWMNWCDTCQAQYEPIRTWTESSTKRVSNYESASTVTIILQKIMSRVIMLQRRKWRRMMSWKRRWRMMMRRMRVKMKM